MKRQAKRPAKTLIAAAILLLAGAALSMTLGRFEISLKELFGVMFYKIIPIEPFWKDITESIIINVRLPRIIAAVLVGAALSVAGASYQCIFRNPMAAPDLLGASTGAAFGAALAILMQKSQTEITLWAFACSVLCIITVLLVSRLCKGNAVLTLVLAGITVGSLFQAGTSYIKLIADPNNTLPEITYWLMGSISGVGLDEIKYLWIPLLLAAIPIFLLRWKMNLLTLDDDEAKTMGVNVKKIRLIVIICSTLLTAASVAVSGVIGWIGLVIPHMSRRLVGNDCRYLIPASALVGGLFLLLTDDIARTLYTTELPLGILTAVIGAPFFIYLLSRRSE